jgi:hypothetical protein
LLLSLHNLPIQLGLIFVGLLWVAEVFRRFPSEMRELRGTRRATRTIAILAVWLVSALIFSWIWRSTALMIGEFFLL